MRRLTKILLLNLLLHGWRPFRDLVRTSRRRHPVRIFTFHRLSRNRKDGMTVTPEDFAVRIDYVRRHHDVVDLHTALALLAGGSRLGRPVAVITFDDGYLSVATEAAPIMHRAGVVGTSFINTDFVGTSKRFDHDAEIHDADCVAVMDWTQVKALHESGWTIGSHTASHQRLSTCTVEDVGRDLSSASDVLREKLRITSPPLAFPFGQPGDISDEALAIAQAQGHAASFGNFGGENWPGRNEFLKYRVDIGGTLPSLAWKAAIHGAAPRNLMDRLVNRRGGARYAPNVT